MYGITSTMPYSYGNDLASLNGIAGTNSYGYSTGFTGGYYGYGAGTSAVNVEDAKTNIANQYDIYATQQAYQGRQATESMSQAERANNMAMMLRDGRETDAIAQFDVLCAELKSSPQYSTYTDAQIKSIAARVYQASTGQDLRSDIANNTPSSFAKGLKEGIPFIGTFFEDNASKNDILAHVTDTPRRGSDQFAKSTGAAISGAVGGAAAASIGACVVGGITAGALSGCAVFSPVTAVVGGIIGLGIGIFKSLTPTK